MKTFNFFAQVLKVSCLKKCFLFPEILKFGIPFKILAFFEWLFFTSDRSFKTDVNLVFRGKYQKFFLWVKKIFWTKKFFVWESQDEWARSLHYRIWQIYLILWISWLNTLLCTSSKLFSVFMSLAFFHTLSLLTPHAHKY